MLKYVYKKKQFVFPGVYRFLFDINELFFLLQENGIAGAKLLRENHSEDFVLEKNNFNCDSVKIEEQEEYTSPIKELFKTDGTTF